MLEAIRRRFGIASVESLEVAEDRRREHETWIIEPIRVGAWEVPKLFRILQEGGEVADEEMLRVFNMGIGMVLVVDPAGLHPSVRKSAVTK